VTASVVDADVHPVYPSGAVLERYLPDRWKEFLFTSKYQSSPGYANAYPPGAATSTTSEARLPAGATADESLTRLRAQALEPWRTDLAILNCYYGIEALRNPDWADALASAVNDWLIEEWLEREPRLRASLLVQAQYPELAAREIDRVGGHPGFVQVLLPVRSERPYGNRSYDPMYEAAVRHDLALGVHFGGLPGHPPTTVGWPTYYFEEYVGMASVFQSQVISMVLEGVFDRFPTLRVALIEGGWTWLPPLLWRLDKEWRGLRRETPWVRRPPSQYIREHMRATLTPIDGPADPGPLYETIEQIGSEEFFLFSTDYPHEHGVDLPGFLGTLDDGFRNRLMGANAVAFYQLDRRKRV
jgi:uncharacterized protein